MEGAGRYYTKPRGGVAEYSMNVGRWREATSWSNCFPGAAALSRSRLDFSARRRTRGRRSLHRLEVHGAPGRSARAGLGTAATARSAADTR